MHHRPSVITVRVSPSTFPNLSDTDPTLSRIAPSPVLLFNHFFAVAFYSLWVMFTHPQPIPSPQGKQQYATPQVWQYPALCFKAIRVFWTACVVFGPLLWTEIRWWSPSDSTRRNKIVMLSTIPAVLLSVLAGAVFVKVREIEAL